MHTYEYGVHAWCLLYEGRSANQIDVHGTAECSLCVCTRYPLTNADRYMRYVDDGLLHKTDFVETRIRGLKSYQT